MAKAEFVQEVKRFGSIILGRALIDAPVYIKDVPLTKLRIDAAMQQILYMLNKLAHAFIIPSTEPAIQALYATTDYIIRLGVEIGYCHPVCVIGSIASLCITILHLLQQGRIASIAEGVALTDTDHMIEPCTDHTADVYIGITPDEVLIEMDEVMIKI